jgi:hypothetical protein
VRALLLLLPLSACSLDLNFTSDATIIHATGDNARSVDVSICGGPSGLLDCNEDHHTFTVTVGGVTEPATEGLISFGTVDATFDVDRLDLGVTVTRDDGATGTVTLPEPFVLAGPTVVRHGDQAVVTWAPGGGDPMTWAADVVCGPDNKDASTGPFATDDDGQAEIPWSWLPHPGPAPCSATVTVTRTRPGTMYDPFPGGSAITGEQTSEVTFSVDP